MNFGEPCCLPPILQEDLSAGGSGLEGKTISSPPTLACPQLQSVTPMSRESSRIEVVCSVMFLQYNLLNCFYMLAKFVKGLQI